MNKIAIRRIARAEAGLIEGLAASGVATVHEAQGRLGLMNPRMSPVQSGARIAGSAVTALCAPGDNSMLHVAIELLQPGDVLIVAAVSECSDGYFGDILAAACRARGAVGAVLDTGVRDVADLRRMKFPVWSSAVSAQGTVKETVVSANVPVVCGGATVFPGDVVVADDDGVVVVPRPSAARVLEAAKAREEKEDAVRRRLDAGEVTLDIFDLRETFAAKGLRYVDGPVDWRRGWDADEG